MKLLLIICVKMFLLYSFAQNKPQNVIKYSSKAEFDSLRKVTKNLKSELNSLKVELNKVKSENKKQIAFQIRVDQKIDSVKLINASNASSITTNYTILTDSINTKSMKVYSDFGIIRNIIKSKTLYGIISIVALLLISFVAYWFGNKFRMADKSELTNELNKTRLSLEDGLVLEFNKQAVILDKELTLITKQAQSVQQAPEIKLDHSLALKVASEINLIERNVRLMDPKAKGLKQVVASVGKLRDNLAANGYDIPELLGKPFNKGMNVIVAMSIIDDTLKAGQEIISRILIPQVNYENKMILTAQIEVSVANS